MVMLGYSGNVDYDSSDSERDQDSNKIIGSVDGQRGGERQKEDDKGNSDDG